MRIAFSEEIPVQDVITAIDGYGALRIAGDRAVKPVYLPLIPYEEPVERTFPDIPSVMAPYPGIARCRKAYAVYGEQGFRIDMHAGILRCDITTLHEVLAHGFHRQGRGDGSFLNHGAYLMDGAAITIGKRCFLGPNCGLYTASHPLDPAQRALGLERALPITLEDDVWLGGHVVILQGVTVGAGSVIGAGSVVTRDIPPGVVAAGNPCRVLRPIAEADRIRP